MHYFFYLREFSAVNHKLCSSIFLNSKPATNKESIFSTPKNSHSIGIFLVNKFNEAANENIQKT